MNFLRYKEKYKDDRFYQEVWEKGFYDSVFRGNRKDIVIDIGALAGEFSFFISPHAKTVYAIEPEEKQFEELIDNILNFEFENVKAFRLAISDENGIGRLSKTGGRGGQSLDNTLESNYEEVKTKTLASFIKENDIKHVDILKIDVESHEHKVFNSPDFKEIAPIIDLIIGEHMNGVADLLVSLGFKKDRTEYNEFFYK